MSAPRRFDWDEAKRLYDAGLASKRQLAERYGVTTTAITFAVEPEKREAFNAYKKVWNAAHPDYFHAPCPDCGGVAAGGRYRSGARCRACHAKHAATSVRDDALRCHRCEQWLPDDAFSPHRGRPERRGRDADCKSCQAARRRAERARRGDEINARARELRAARRKVPA